MSLPDWFMERVRVDESGCWIWTGAKTSSGYAEFERGGRKFRAHRWAAYRLAGDAHGDLDAHHLCGVRACVNPEHLELMTRAAHARVHGFGSGEARGASLLRKNLTHCKNGHPFDEANTYVTTKGQRQCRACNNERSKARYHLRRKRTGPVAAGPVLAERPAPAVKQEMELSAAWEPTRP